MGATFVVVAGFAIQALIWGVAGGLLLGGLFGGALGADGFVPGAFFGAILGGGLGLVEGLIVGVSAVILAGRIPDIDQRLRSLRRIAFIATLVGMPVVMTVIFEDDIWRGRALILGVVPVALALAATAFIARLIEPWYRMLCERQAARAS